MSAVVEQIVLEDTWYGLYGESWKGLICDEAFAHPAKFSRALIRKIYDHVIAEGWAAKGSSVVDPFGGVALGSLDAMRHGLNWYGCELESKFIGLGNQNIAFFNDRFSRMPNWGTARLIQGDSRKLVEVLSVAECRVSSPPYIEPCGHGGGKGSIKKEKSINEPQYGHSPGQIAEMPEGDLGLAITSPPYAESLANAKNYADPEKARVDSEREFMRNRSAIYSDLRYGETEGQLGAMKEGDHSIAISSPPYLNGEKGHPSLGSVNNDDWGHDGRDITRRRGKTGEYGITEGQLGAMPEGQLCVSSPPFESSTQVNNTPGDITAGRARWEGGKDSAARVKQDYADYGDGNLGNMRGGFEAAISSPPYEGSRIQQAGEGGNAANMRRPNDREPYGDDANNLGKSTGETFWSASRLILEQLHQVIIPGGHAVFVVKAFVRDKKIVDFPSQWAQLCEAVGFKLLHHHRASLVEHSGTQGGFYEDKEIRVERKSFFRRLHEKKHPGTEINWENVQCFIKPA